MKLALDSIKEARFGSVINEDDLEVVRDKLGNESPDRRYSVIVHYNELQTSQEFATALNKAHPAIAVRKNDQLYLFEWCDKFWLITLLFADV